MRVKCPGCKTSYDMKPLANSSSQTTIICAVCKSHMEISPPSWRSMFLPKVVIRKHPDIEEEE